MFSKTIKFQDMTVRVDLNGVTVMCRNLVKKLNGSQLAELLYPLINEQAKTLDKKPN